MGNIYIIKNTVNSKVYIGQTRYSIQERLLDFGITQEEIDIRGKHLRGKPVIQKDLENNILNIFPTAAEAGRYLGLNSYSQISNCCTGRRKTAYGYKWEYYERGDKWNFQNYNNQS